jgi:hypothetical protein
MLIEARYINNVTGDAQQSPPPNFYGGLPADQTGLGKSLSVISLIASNPHRRQSEYAIKLPDSLKQAKGTLLIVPLPRKYISLTRSKTTPELISSL